MSAFALVTVLLYTATIPGVDTDDTLMKKSPSVRAAEKSEFCGELCRDVIGVRNPNTNYNGNYIFDRSLYYHKVDTLPQVRFWRNIMNLHQDSAFVSVAYSRQLLGRIDIRDWDRLTDEQKSCYRDSLKAANGLDTSCRVLITTGKRFFYDFDRTSLNFEQGIRCFMENGVDPWYAQAILLIESPNKLQKSNAGAYGPFQLMKDVARTYGLKVNRHVDERADFSRSAYAASSLLKNICIPRARVMLDSLKIPYSPDDLWFRLLVMHVYHAGAYNVQKALFSNPPASGGMELVYNLWRTHTARFKSASQNYSQLVLAAMLEMNARSNLRPIEAGEEVSAN